MMSKSVTQGGFIFQRKLKKAKLQSTRTESCPTPLALIVDHHVINNVLKDLQCRESELLSE